MRPTAKAQKLAEDVQDVQDGLRLLSNSLGEGHAFNPLNSRQTFVFAATDFTTFALRPKLVASIQTAAPRIRIKVEYARRRDSMKALLSKPVHFGLGIADAHLDGHPGLNSVTFADDDYVVLAREGQPRITGKLTLARYTGERHVAVLLWDTEMDVINATLLRLKLSCDVAMELPSMLATPSIVAVSDLLATLPHSIAVCAVANVPVTILQAPFEPIHIVRVFFHERHASGAAYRWMLQQMIEVLAVSQLRSDGESR